MILQDDNIIREYLKMYYISTGIASFATDDKGESLYSEGPVSMYCQKFKELSGNNCPCKSAHLKAGRQSEKIGDGYIYSCPGGLIHWTASIIVKGLYMGALVGGPVQMCEPDGLLIDDIIRINDFDVQNRGILHAYINAVPIVEPERVRYLSNMLYVVAKALISEESGILSERKKFYQEQAKINESIQYVKDLDYSEHISKYYPIDLEDELMSKVKSGDKKGAKIILNELLGYALFSSGNNFEITKAKVLELMIMLSRAAVEGGGNLEMIFGLKLRYL
ncbi:MAG TPA: hypothetical protein DD426_00550, partial [Clostridiaceae bacterium]|nr:hypothetical protein [Clostridiaceae bacterium]